MIRPTKHLLALACASAVATSAEAQRTAPAALPSAAAHAAADSACTYARCALWIAPRWHALDVARGDRRERAGTLDFFWPRDVRPTFAGSDSAVHAAGRAVRRRRLGAALTDLGAIGLAVGSARIARHGDLHAPGGGLALAGVALLGASVPVQFAADGELSRAVWWYNARFGR